MPSNRGFSLHLLLLEVLHKLKIRVGIKTRNLGYMACLSLAVLLASRTALAGATL